MLRTKSDISAQQSEGCAVLARPTDPAAALDLDLLMAVIAVCLAPAVHPIAADIILTALAVWAMRNSR